MTRERTVRLAGIDFEVEREGGLVYLRHPGWPLVSMALLAFSLAACIHSAPENGPASVVNADPATRPAAIVRTSTLQAEGEQTYMVLYADGGASGLIVVYAEAGLLYGTGVPDSWTWLDGQTVEICASVDILRNEVGFPPMERDCGPHPITGKEPTPQVAECSDPEVASVVAEYFELVSGPAGERDRASFSALFLPAARLHALGVGADGSNVLYPQTPAQYADHLGEYVREQGFHHRPLRPSIDCSGRLARALVSFESRNSREGELIDSGHIAFHLLHDGESWRIAHVMWQSRPGS